MQSNLYLEELKQYAIQAMLEMNMPVKREHRLPKIIHIDYQEGKEVHFYFEKIDEPVWFVYRCWWDSFIPEATQEEQLVRRSEFYYQPQSCVSVIIDTQDKIHKETLESYLGCIATPSLHKLNVYIFQIAPVFWEWHRQLKTSLNVLETLPKEILDMILCEFYIETYGYSTNATTYVVISQEYISQLASLKSSVDIRFKRNLNIMSEEPYIYNENLEGYVNETRTFRRDETYKENCLKLRGFELEPENDPEIRIDDENGHLLVAFNFMPPMSFELREEDYEFFSSKMAHYIGVEVLWEDREFFLIQYYKKDTITKLIDFIENFRSREGHL